MKCDSLSAEIKSVDANNNVVYCKQGRLVVVTIMNLCPEGYTMTSKLPTPAIGNAYNAVKAVSGDGQMGIFQVASDGALLCAIGNTALVYTGEIVYMCN